MPRQSASPQEKKNISAMERARAAIEHFLYLPAYVIMFSVYPALEMYASNVHGIPAGDLIRPLAVSLALVFVVYLIFRLTVRRPLTSALATVSIAFFFFNYGHIRNFLYANGIIISKAALASIWLALLLVMLVWIISASAGWQNENIAPAMNLTTIILLLFPLVRLGIYHSTSAMPLERKIPETIQLQTNANSPDIYYIILDGYTRSDVMKSDYGYDNTPFLTSLQEMGFYVAECSQSNYGLTSLSVSSSLNLDYVQNISSVFRPDETDLLPAFKLLRSNTVRNSLAAAGYNVIVFASGFHWIEWRDADQFISPPKEPLSEFEIVILFSTYARLLDDFGIINLDDLHAEHYRNRTRLILNSFDDLLDIPSPKFVFIHVIAPHEPFAFDKNGSPISPDKVNNRNGYAGQAEFISNAIAPNLKKLVEESPTPPVIILQGDHGRLGDQPENLLKILNAYYLPGEHSQALYPSISPVNTFRVVLNSYFGTDYPLLEDISYYSRLTRKYDFTVIPNECHR
jgi:hypothetical protein